MSVFQLAFVAARGNDARLLALALVGSVFGIYLFYRGFKILQRKRLIQNTPTSKIRAAAVGLVEVNGLATGPYTIPAPITGLPCYYYRSVAWQLKQSGKNEHWEKVADESLHVPFFVDDNTGMLLVDPQGAEMDIHRDFCETYSNSLFSMNLGVPSGVAGFLGRHGIGCDKKTKVEEFCIKPKNSLFILGTLSPNHGVTVAATPVRSLVTDLPKFAPSSSLLYFQSVFSHTGEINSIPVPIVRSAPDHSPANDTLSQPSGKGSQDQVASALLRAGITNPAAWAVAGVMDVSEANAVSATSASGSAAAARTAPEPFDLKPDKVLMKGVRNPMFLISWRSQRDVVRSLGWKSALMIWGGPSLTLLCVYVLSAYFGWF
ncbi:MAG: GIDE domain-containing protein [Terriglobales bacterium]